MIEAGAQYEIVKSHKGANGERVVDETRLISMAIKPIEFEFDFASGQMVAKDMGRINLSQGTMRLCLLPDGMHALITKEMIENGSVQIIEEGKI
jgi:hypothetical protein